ncbi:G-type lectin S-receptor-like serine/threonine-protein kinase At2g19130 [Argentina anserina]|uniref:G-type lectin S-receptor-like serine/threonine-protein kinase At2g19130 n=1 Tax=Argentina anserina TaxID=57926 RepID=UPI0021766066|nr:G-type lectin S-receptor-like serine/threonine-protein kinase At2g19130 [Potentilla anserina]
MESKQKPRFLLSLLFISICLKSNLCSGADTITANQSLSGDHTIVSAGGKFELGFFKPGNSSNYYIGMWYYKTLVSLQTIVWVANREQPVSDRFSSELRISDGNLVLFNESKLPIWSTEVRSSSGSSVHVVLLDNGNLVLRAGSESSLPLWQSFDHPAHTWLPEARIGFNKVTNITQVLTSWKNVEDPAPGLYSLELDPNGTDAYFILWNRSRQYYTTGAWDSKNKIFSLVPEMRRNYIYNFNYSKNKNESYFTYSVYDQTVSRFIMDVSGQIKQLSWLPSQQWNFFWSQPRQQCQVYAYCGAFGSCNVNSLPFCTCVKGFEPKTEVDWNLTDNSGGCKRLTMLNVANSTTSSNGKEDRFSEMPSMSLPDNAVSTDAGSTAQCEIICLSNPSCTAYAYDSSECSIWIGDLLNLQQLTGDGNGKTLYLRLAASEFKDPKSKRGLIIGVVVCSAVGIAVLLGVVVVVVLRNRYRVIGKTVEGSLVAFEYRDLQEVTKNFSEKLGGGGFGSVFKGTMPDSSVIAVKKLESVSQGEKQFRTEVSTIGTIQHVNLVRLRGFCSEGAKRLLVYDYMPNGSLDAHLFSCPSDVLNWKTRYQIALGTARGLAYLHEKCRDCIIHCDIKPENILLDAELCPKVADFGLAKLVGREFSRVLTTMRGTRGYLAPEWISGIAVTAKADVYSYGMMLFEIVSGRRNSDPSEDGKVKFFPTWAAGVITSTEESDVLSLLDPKLGRIGDVEEVIRVLRVAFWCVQDEEIHRPSMGQVVQILEGVLDVNLPSVPRSLQVFGDSQHIVFFTESSSSQSSHTPSNNTSSTSSQAKSTTSSTTSKISE